MHGRRDCGQGNKSLIFAFHFDGAWKWLDGKGWLFALLSSCRVVFDVDLSMLVVRFEQSQFKSLSHVASSATRVGTMYSDSIDDKTTVGCRFEHLLTGPPFNIKRYPAVSILLSLSPARSESGHP